MKFDFKVAFTTSRSNKILCSSFASSITFLFAI